MSVARIPMTMPMISSSMFFLPLVPRISSPGVVRVCRVAEENKVA